MTTVERVGVVGSGLMGIGIAEVAGKAGLSVTVVDSSDEALSVGGSRLEASLKRAEERGKIDSAADVMSRVRLVDDLAALTDAEVVVEAIVEDEAAKIALFRRLDDIVADEHAILASNTSSIPVVNLARVTSRPQHVVGMHFFNPVPVLPLVELAPSLLADDDTVRRAHAFLADDLGKSVITCADRAGYVVNAILVPFILSAIRMVESGYATAADVDKGLQQGAAHPQGPLALADLIGLDTLAAVAESLYAEFRDPVFVSPPLLNRMVSSGRLGRKSGRGFYAY